MKFTADLDEALLFGFGECLQAGAFGWGLPVGAVGAVQQNHDLDNVGSPWLTDAAVLRLSKQPSAAVALNSSAQRGTGVTFGACLLLLRRAFAGFDLRTECGSGGGSHLVLFRLSDFLVAANLTLGHRISSRFGLST